MKAIDTIRNTNDRLGQIQEYRQIIAKLKAGEKIDYISQTYPRDHQIYLDHIKSYQELLLNALENLRDDIMLAKYIVALADTPAEQIPTSTEIDELRVEIRKGCV